MSVTTGHLPRPLPTQSPTGPPPKSLLRPFDETLALRLRSLPPLPPSISLSWLAAAADLLAASISGAAAIAGDPSLSGSDPAALAAHLESSLALLDACNAASAEIERLRRRRFLLRFALHLLALPADPRRLRRAREAVAEWEAVRKPEARMSVADRIRRQLVPAGGPPRGKMSAVRRAMDAVETVGSFVMAAVLAFLSGGYDGDNISMIRASEDVPWAEAFEDVRAVVSGAFGEGFSSGVEAAVRKLAAAMDEEDDDGGKTERCMTAASEVERVTEELTEGLDRLADGINGVFRAAMDSRNAALLCLRIGPNKCK